MVKIKPSELRWDGLIFTIELINKKLSLFIQQQKINWHLFKTQNDKIAKLNKLMLDRVNLSYSNFNFDSKYYWNIKLSSISLVSLRPNLKMIQTNLITDQELLKK